MTHYRPPLSEMRHAGTVLDNQYHPCELYLPPADIVTRHADMLLDGVCPWPLADIPPESEDRWDRDNICLVGYLLAGGWRDVRGHLRPCIAQRIAKRNRHALDWLVEAYLSVVRYDGGMVVSAEQALCDGATCWPDRWQSGFRIKDPESVAHDVEWTRHYAGDIPDAFGRVPDLRRSNDWFADVCAGFGDETGAAVKREALDTWLAVGRWKANQWRAKA